MRGGKRGGPRTGKQSIDLAEKQLSPKSSKQLEAVNSQKGPHKQITESKLAKKKQIYNRNTSSPFFNCHFSEKNINKILILGNHFIITIINECNI